MYKAIKFLKTQDPKKEIAIQLFGKEDEQPTELGYAFWLNIYEPWDEPGNLYLMLEPNIDNSPFKRQTVESLISVLENVNMQNVFWLEVGPYRKKVELKSLDPTVEYLGGLGVHVQGVDFNSEPYPPETLEEPNYPKEYMPGVCLDIG